MLMIEMEKKLCILAAFKGETNFYTIGRVVGVLLVLYQQPYKEKSTISLTRTDIPTSQSNKSQMKQAKT